MQVKLATGAAGASAVDLLVIGVFVQENILTVLKELGGKVDQNLILAMSKMAEEDGFAGKLGQQLILPTYGQAPFKKIFLFGLGNSSEITLSSYRKLGIQMAKRITALFARIEEAAKSADKTDGKKTVNSSAKPKQIAVPLKISLLMRQANQEKSGKEANANANAARKNKATAAAAQNLSCTDCLAALIESLMLTCFSFTKYKTDDKKTTGDLDKCELNVFSDQLDAQSIKRAALNSTAMASATNMARALIAEPPAEMTPTRLAAEASRIAAEQKLSLKILDPEQVKKLGMGAFLGVARGAREPLRLIVLKYTAAKAKKTIGLIGKGVTFDSGGLSLKTAVGMEHMKYDMAGAAAVLAAMQVIGGVKPNVSVLAVVAATENMPGSAALHPGDVLKSMNGKTIEVNNTDAEGRLILADAITYALRHGADEIIDIATLTGAVVSALGRVAAGIMGSDQKLVDAVIASGAASGEQYWQLPLFVEYKDALKSEIADLKNAGSRGEAGSSAAAMFLKEFTEGKPWAHLDIAGMAWLDRERDEFCKGGTGFGARTLVNYVLSQASN